LSKAFALLSYLVNFIVLNNTAIATFIRGAKVGFFSKKSHIRRNIFSILSNVWGVNACKKRTFAELIPYHNMKVPKIEGLIIFVFFICVALWAVSKCSARRSEIGRKLQEMSDEREERPVRRDTVFVPQPQPQPVPQPYSTQSPAPAPPSQTPVRTTSPAATAPAPSRTPAAQQPTAAAPAANKYSTLYVTIDGLNLRKAPSLKSETIEQLGLYEAVSFLNKKSEKPEEVNLGTETVTDYWVKIRTKSGKEGWVFGAGVHYYKVKRN
jgi:hypothetical protein